MCVFEVFVSGTLLALSQSDQALSLSLYNAIKSVRRSSSWCVRMLVVLIGSLSAAYVFPSRNWL